MQIATEAAARAQGWIRAARSFLERLAARVLAEMHMTVDLSRWRQAGTPADRLAAISWPRLGAFAAVPLGLFAGLLALHALTRPDAYPPPLPSERARAHTQTAVRDALRTPPPASLVEANKTWTGAS